MSDTCFAYTVGAYVHRYLRALSKADKKLTIFVIAGQKWIKYIVGCKCKLQIIKITKKNCEPKHLQNYKLLGKLPTDTIVCAA